MMILYIKRAIQDLRNNRFLATITVAVISVSILIVSDFALFLVNVHDLMASWRSGLRVQVYLERELSLADRQKVEQQIRQAREVRDFRFISRDEALEIFKSQLRGQASIVADLKENPLPDAFELQLIPEYQDPKQIEMLADSLTAHPAVESVEYGQKWLGRFSAVFDVVAILGYAMGALLLMAAVFIVGNTTRLVLYSRSEEVTIMRLVGATDGFIKAPLYIEGVIQGLIGGGVGLAASVLTFLFISSGSFQSMVAGGVQIRFLPPSWIAGILAGSMAAGWLGCHVSLKHIFKS